MSFGPVYENREERTKDHYIVQSQFKQYLKYHTQATLSMSWEQHITGEMIANLSQLRHIRNGGLDKNTGTQ